MKPVELIYDYGCPNILQARTCLLRAFSEAGVSAEWVEWERGDPSSPLYVRSYGSPTVLVDGKDVAGIDPAGEVSCCRLYAGANGGYNGAPSVGIIAAALRKPQDGPGPEDAGKGRTGWRSSFGVLPGIGASLLPVGVCPACWPAYAGLLSSLGFGFLLETAYLLPLTVLFLVFAVAAMAYRARTRRGYGPFILGLVAASIVLVGKFVFGSDTAMYGGIIMLVAASLWNAWPHKTVGGGKDVCPSCASHGSGVVNSTNRGANEK
ncbi:hypothetical protein MNBD_DELTA01-13 [hydrothermal vent metagenome]|uniref:Uncharacterized protein n=1 Tax=hydrothermal vent metagenome TaxID=652676 RepID=A0A3B0R7J0_9ZZZZ